MSQTRSTRTGYAASPLRTTAAVVGAVFVVVGIAGFVPGITTDVDRRAPGIRTLRLVRGVGPRDDFPALPLLGELLAGSGLPVTMANSC